MTPEVMHAMKMLCLWADGERRTAPNKLPRKSRGERRRALLDAEEAFVESEIKKALERTETP